MRLRTLFATLFAASTPAMALTVGNWEVSYFPDSSKPTGCMMTGSYVDGTRFSLIVTSEYKWGLMLSNPEWQLRDDGSTDVAAYVDGRFIAGGQAKHLDRTSALLMLSSEEQFRALQIGHGLTLQTPRGNLKFQLTGTSRAMDAVLDCVKLAKRQPAKPVAETASVSDSRMLSHAETADLLIGVFKSAGITDYEIEAQDDKSSVVGFKLKDGTNGMFGVATGKNTRSAEDHAGVVLGHLSRVCNGEFLSGRKSMPTSDGSVVRQVFTTCRTDQQTVTSESTIIRRPDGMLVELTNVLPSGSLSPDSESAADDGNQFGSRDRAALVDAAMRVDN